MNNQNYQPPVDAHNSRVVEQARGYQLREDAKALARQGFKNTAKVVKGYGDALLYPHGKPAS